MAMTIIGKTTAGKEIGIVKVAAPNYNDRQAKSTAACTPIRSRTTAYHPLFRRRASLIGRLPRPTLHPQPPTPVHARH